LYQKEGKREKGEGTKKEKERPSEANVPVEVLD
jgi:hypothetical protein